MYVNTYRSRSTGLQLKLAVVRFYTPTEITEARQLLCDHVKDLNPEFPNLNKKRVDSATRSASDVMTDDIIDMFKAIDAVAIQPKFVSDDASRIPGCPESAGNMLTLYDDLATQRNELAQLQETVTKMIQNVSKNTSDIGDLKAAPRANKAKGSVQVVNHVELHPAEETQRAQPTAVADGASGTSSAGANSYAQKAASSGENHGEFQVVGTNQGKRPNKGKSKIQPKRQGTGGAGGDSNVLMAGPSTFTMQITNVSPSLSTEDIKKFITDKGMDIEPSDVTDHSSEGWNTKRFLLTFDYKHVDKVMSEDFWPKKIFFKRWFTFKAKAQTTKSS